MFPRKQNRESRSVQNLTLRETDFIQFMRLREQPDYCSQKFSRRARTYNLADAIKLQVYVRATHFGAQIGWCCESSKKIYSSESAVVQSGYPRECIVFRLHCLQEKRRKGKVQQILHVDKDFDEFFLSYVLRVVLDEFITNLPLILCWKMFCLDFLELVFCSSKDELELRRW